MYSDKSETEARRAHKSHTTSFLNTADAPSIYGLMDGAFIYHGRQGGMSNRTGQNQRGLFVRPEEAVIYKRCPRCRARILEGSVCTKCRPAYEEPKPTGTRAVYRTYRWQKLQKAIMAMYGSIDQYAAMQGRLETATLVHHIVPADEHPERFFDASNLIPVSRQSHDAIHEIYRQSQKSKEILQKELMERVLSPH